MIEVKEKKPQGHKDTRIKEKEKRKKKKEKRKKGGSKKSVYDRAINCELFRLTPYFSAVKRAKDLGGIGLIHCSNLLSIFR